MLKNGKPIERQTTNKLRHRALHPLHVRTGARVRRGDELTGWHQCVLTLMQALVHRHPLPATDTRASVAHCRDIEVHRAWLKITGLMTRDSRPTPRRACAPGGPSLSEFRDCSTLNQRALEHSALLSVETFNHSQEHCLASGDCSCPLNSLTNCQTRPLTGMCILFGCR